MLTTKQICTHMQYAVKIARESIEYGEFPVGALILDKSGTIISENTNRVERDGNPLYHAECLAMQSATRITRYRDLRDFILVTTLEPCQLCTEACKLYRIGGVIFGGYNRGKSYQSPAEWIGGIEQAAAEELLFGVFDTARTSKSIRNR